MIVCVCNVLCEQRCREAAGHPDARSVGCIYRRLGCRVRCGKCVPFMQDLFATAQQGKANPLPEATTPPTG